MKRKNIIAIALMVMVSCEKNEVMLCDSSDGYSNELLQNDVVINQIELVSDIFWTDVMKSRSVNTNKRIRSVETICNDSNEALCHIVNYENNNGYMIIDATHNYHPVLAYSEIGEFDSSKLSDETKLWLEGYEIEINKYKELEEDSVLTFRSEWARYEKKQKRNKQARTVDTSTPLYHTYDSITMEYINKWTGEGKSYFYLWENTIPYLPDHRKEAFTHQALSMTLPGADDLEFAFAVLKIDDKSKKKYLNVTSKWGQQNGYNDGLITWWSGTQPPAGCAPVAMGQIMRYYNWPNGYDWAKMADAYPTAETVNLLRNIGINASTVHSMDGSSTTVNGMQKAFNKMGYSAKKINHDMNKVITSLNNNCLVLMGGNDRSHGGHVWVCDGYNSYLTSYTYQLMVLTRNTKGELVYEQMDYEMNSFGYTSYHMVWGFYGNADGWYKDYNISITVGQENRNYYKDRFDFVQINPNR